MWERRICFSVSSPDDVGIGRLARVSTDWVTKDTGHCWASIRTSKRSLSLPPSFSLWTLAWHRRLEFPPWNWDSPHGPRRRSARRPRRKHSLQKMCKRVFFPNTYSTFRVKFTFHERLTSEKKINNNKCSIIQSLTSIFKRTTRWRFTMWLLHSELCKKITKKIYLNETLLTLHDFLCKNKQFYFLTFQNVMS